MQPIQGTNRSIYKAGLSPASPGNIPGSERLRLTKALVSKDPLCSPLTQGYKIDIWHDKDTEEDFFVLVIAAHSDKLIDIFEDFLDLMEGELALVLETSHNYSDHKHDNLWRYDVEPWYIKHILRQNSNLFLNDSYTGIAVCNLDQHEEIQFDEHKCLFVYSKNVEQFKEILENYGVAYDKNLHLISEAEHEHFIDSEYQSQFEELATEIGVSGELDEDEELFTG